MPVSRSQSVGLAMPGAVDADEVAPIGTAGVELTGAVVRFGAALVVDRFAAVLVRRLAGLRAVFLALLRRVAGFLAADFFARRLAGFLAALRFAVVFRRLAGLRAAVFFVDRRLVALRFAGALFVVRRLVVRFVLLRDAAFLVVRRLVVVLRFAVVRRLVALRFAGIQCPLVWTRRTAQTRKILPCRASMWVDSRRFTLTS